MATHVEAGIAQTMLGANGELRSDAGAAVVAVRLPELVDRVLDPEVPDQVADQRQQEPQTPDRRDRSYPTLALVHLLDLAGHQEHGDRRDQDRHEQIGDTAETGVVVLLELLTVLVRPHDRPDAKRDNRQEKDQPLVAALSHRTGRRYTGGRASDRLLVLRRRRHGIGHGETLAQVGQPATTTHRQRSSRGMNRGNVSIGAALVAGYEARVVCAADRLAGSDRQSSELRTVRAILWRGFRSASTPDSNMSAAGVARGDQPPTW